MRMTGDAYLRAHRGSHSLKPNQAPMRLAIT